MRRELQQRTSRLQQPFAVGTFACHEYPRIEVEGHEARRVDDGHPIIIGMVSQVALVVAADDVAAEGEVVVGQA